METPGASIVQLCPRLDGEGRVGAGEELYATGQGLLRPAQAHTGSSAANFNLGMLLGPRSSLKQNSTGFSRLVSALGAAEISKEKELNSASLDTIPCLCVHPGDPASALRGITQAGQC